MREKRKGPVRISSILSKTARRLKLNDGIRSYKLWDKWSEIVGAAVAPHARPTRWQNGALIVRVEHSAWMQELQFLKQQMIARIKEILPETNIKEIRFELGSLPPIPQSDRMQSAVRTTRILTKDEKEFIDQAASAIDDPDVRAAAERAMKRGFEMGRR